MTEPPPPAPSRLLTTPWPGLYISDHFAPREQFSASQDSTAEGCLYSWGLRYLVGLRPAEPVWSASGLSKRDHTLAFGKELHRRLECHFKGLPVDWTDDVGQRALAGLHLLPSAPPVYVEQPIAFKSERYLAGVEPISYIGFKDLNSPVLGLGGNGKLYDYKSTGDFRWMKKPAELVNDLAACIYADDDMVRYDLPDRDCRWVYFARTGRPEARPVDFIILRDHAKVVIRSALVRAIGLRSEVREFRAAREAMSPVDRAFGPRALLPLIDHLTKNTRTCKSYSGCPYHFSAGGPCTAEATPGVTLAPDNYDNVTEPKQKADPNMVTLAERLAAANAQTSAPVAPPNAAQPFPGAANPGPGAFDPNASAFPSPAGALASPFAVAASMPAVAPVAPAPPPVAPTAPVAPFAGFPAVTAPAQAQPFPGAPPTQAPPAGYGAAPAWAGVNPPEQHTQPAAVPAPPPAGALAPVPPVAPPAKRGRRTKAQIAADNAAAQAAGASLPLAAPGEGLLTVTIRVTDGEGSAVELPAPAAWAELICAHVDPMFQLLAI